MDWPGDKQKLLYTPRTRAAGWAGRRFRLGKNKGVFDAELFALYQVSEILDSRNGTGQDYLHHFVGFYGGGRARLVRRHWPRTEVRDCDHRGM